MKLFKKLPQRILGDFLMKIIVYFSNYHYYYCYYYYYGACFTAGMPMPEISVPSLSRNTGFLSLFIYSSYFISCCFYDFFPDKSIQQVIFVSCLFIYFIFFSRFLKRVALIIMLRAQISQITFVLLMSTGHGNCRRSCVFCSGKLATF